MEIRFRKESSSCNKLHCVTHNHTGTHLQWKELLLQLIVNVLLLFIGDEFRSRLDTIMTQALRKGVPPLFNNLRSLYHNRDKV